MSCTNCGYWAFTSRGENTSTCNRCGKKHKRNEDGDLKPISQATTVRDR